jgi:homoserine kinase
MIQNDRFVIKVPASTANLGPGFDSMGLAVDLYLTLEVEKSETWDIQSVCDELKDLPTDESHFICQIAIKTAENYGIDLHPCKIKVDSDIPLARGLGSSAAAIVAGIELADMVGRLELTQKEKLLIATKVEGHPDNVGASLLGGLVIGSYQQDEVDMLSISNIAFEMVAMIPEEILLTKDSRGVLPSEFSREAAIQASSTANLLVASLLTKNWKLAGKMMEQDLFHQPYRKLLMNFYQEIEDIAKSNGAFGVALSGAGPTVLCFAEKGKGKQLAQGLQSAFSSMSAKLLNIDYTGSSVNTVERFIK